MDSFLEYMIEQKRSAGITIKKILLYFASFILGFVVTAIMLVISFETITFMPLVIIAFLYGAFGESSITKNGSSVTMTTINKDDICDSKYAIIKCTSSDVINVTARQTTGWTQKMPIGTAIFKIS